MPASPADSPRQQHSAREAIAARINRRSRLQWEIDAALATARGEKLPPCPAIISADDLDMQREFAKIEYDHALRIDAIAPGVRNSFEAYWAGRVNKSRAARRQRRPDNGKLKAVIAPEIAAAAVAEYVAGGSSVPICRKHKIPIGRFREVVESAGVTWRTQASIIAARKASAA